MENIKRSWKDISIKDYRYICEISNRDLDSDLEKDLALCAFLNGIDEQDMYAKSVAETKQLLADMEWIKKPFTFNYKWGAKTLSINGKKCKMYQSIEELTMAQYLDFQAYWDERDEKMGNVLACFIVPDGEEYNKTYNAVDFAEELEDALTIQDWNAIAFFLLRGWLISIRASARYGAWMITKMIWKEKDKAKKRELREVRRELIRRLRSLPS